MARIAGSIVVLGIADYATGYELSFFVFYFIPVSLAAYHFGLVPAVGASIACAITWALAQFLAGIHYSSYFVAVWDTAIRLVAFIAIGVAVARISALLAEQRAIARQLHKTLAELNVLEGMLPICAQCKNIREDSGQWLPLETYITRHSEAQFSHGICPGCKRRLLEEAGLGGGEPIRARSTLSTPGLPSAPPAAASSASEARQRPGASRHTGVRECSSEA